MIENQVEEQMKQTSSFRYAIGMFGTSIPINMFKTFAPIYYVDQLGITTRQFSIVLTVTAITDLLFVYLFGALSDRQASHKGRRKWILYGTPLLSLAFIFFFNNQRLQQSRALFFYLLILYVAVAMLDGMININYGALFPELFQEEKERVVANAYRQICQLLAMILSMAGTPILVEHFGYGRVAIVYGLIAWIVISYSAWGYYEPERITEKRTSRKINWSQIGSMVKEPLLWLYGGATLFYSVAFSLFTQGMSFYTRYTLQAHTTFNSLLLFSVFCVTIVTIFLLKYFGAALKIEPLWSYSFLIIAVGFLIIAISSNIAGAFLGGMMIGVGMGGMMTSSDIIGAKVIDIDLKKNKKVRTGLFMSFFNSMFRLNGLFVGIAYFLTEVMYGFVSGEQTGHAPHLAASFLFLYFPFIVVLVGFVFSCSFIRKR